jgi:hypothetical protein
MLSLSSLIGSPGDGYTIPILLNSETVRTLASFSRLSLARSASSGADWFLTGTGRELIHKFRRSNGYIGPAVKIRYYRDTVSAGQNHIARTFPSNAANGNQGLANPSPRLGNHTETNDCIGVCFRRCREYRPDRDIVDAQAGRRYSLFYSMSRESYNSGRPKQAPRFFGRQVVLSQMDPVGIRCQRHVSPIIDDYSDATRPCGFDAPSRGTIEVVSRRIFVSDLNEGGAPLYQLGDLIEMGQARKPPIGDRVQPRKVEFHDFHRPERKTTGPAQQPSNDTGSGGSAS